MEEGLDLVDHVMVEVLGRLVDHVMEAGLLSVVTAGILDFYHYNLDTHFSVAGMASFLYES